MFDIFGQKTNAGSEQYLENVGKLVSNRSFKAPKTKWKTQKPGYLFGSEIV